MLYCICRNYQPVKDNIISRPTGEFESFGRKSFLGKDNPPTRPSCNTTPDVLKIA